MNPQKQILPSRDAVTAFQVNTCLSVAQTMLQFLAQQESEINNPHKSGMLDGGARASCETTLIHACNRLDSILTDNTRFDLEIQRLLELQLAKLMNEQRIFLQAQTAAAQAIATPTYLHEPTIINAGNGEFVALLGDPENPACLGVGKSPAEACEDFNKSFAGQTTENQLRWLQEHPETPPTEPTPKKPRKKK